jgi:tRNA (guanine-N7-)-methyltransferase
MREAGGVQQTSAPHYHQCHYPQRSRMTIGQQRAWGRNWDRWGAAVADLPDGPLDTTGWFGRAAPVVLEIGSGMGEATAAAAVADPGRDLLAVDVHTPGHGSLLRRVEEAGLTNVRVADGDARVLLADMLGEGVLDEVRVWFPDPWPKARHAKRRLVQPAFLELVATRLRPGGTLHVATDWAPYAEQVERALAASPLRQVPGDRRSRPPTRFEQQGLAAGRAAHDLVAVRP